MNLKRIFVLWFFLFPISNGVGIAFLIGGVVTTNGLNLLLIGIGLICLMWSFPLAVYEDANNEWFGYKKGEKQEAKNNRF